LFLVLFMNPPGGGAPEPNALGQPLLDATGNPREDAFFETRSRRGREVPRSPAARLKQILLETSAISQRDKATGNLYGAAMSAPRSRVGAGLGGGVLQETQSAELHRKTFRSSRRSGRATSFEIQFAARGKTYNLTLRTTGRRFTPARRERLESRRRLAATGSAARLDCRPETSKARRC
jgi:hypothetical protein